MLDPNKPGLFVVEKDEFFNNDADDLNTIISTSSLFIDEFHSVFNDIKFENPLQLLKASRRVICVTATIGEKGEERIQDQF